MSRSVRFPERPAIPPSLYALVAVLLVERWTLGLGVVPPTLFVCVAAVTGASLLWVHRKRSQESVQGIAACASSAVLASLLVCSCVLWLGRDLTATLGSTSMSVWTFEALSDSSPTDTGYRCRARARRAGSVSGDVWLSTSDALRRGDVIEGIGRYRENGDDDFGRANRQQGVWGSVTILRVQRKDRAWGLRALPTAVREAARLLIEPEASDERAVLAGIVLGDRTEMRNRELDKLFATCGVAHLVAVSGSHIAVVSALCAGMLEHTGMRPSRRLAVQLLVTLAFVAMCGAPPSAVRAWAMSVVSCAGTLAGRRLDGTSSACLVAIALALVDPTLSGQLGFLLSVVCVVSLCVFASYATAVIEVLLPDVRLPRGAHAETRIRVGSAREACARSLGASLVAQAAALPLVGSVFSRVSLIAPLSMLFVSAPLSGALGVGLVGLMLAPFPLASRTMLRICDWLLWVALAALRALAGLPYASIPVSVQGSVLWVGVLAVALAVLIVWPRPSRIGIRDAALAATLIVLVTIVHWRYFAPARVCVLDVGQGDAILVQDGPSAILVDAGPPDGSVARALGRKHVLHLDAVVITHLHDDHYGGVADLEGCVGVGEVIVAAGAADNLPEELSMAIEKLVHTPCREVAYDNKLQVGGFSLQVVWPRTEVDGLSNAESLELSVVYEADGRKLTGLLTGDAEQDELRAIIEADDVGRLDFLKVGHHGSEISLTQDQAETLSPEVAVASAGKDNPYGHPCKECVERLVGAGARFLCTKDVGDVELRPARGGVAVKTATRRR